ncbi:MAG: fused MFS/spermidine synthase [Anaerolineales bacterium]|nr:fused MFS/spermidine synthase [Anaerolineales bacterium]
MSRRYLYFAVFSSGMTTLAIEFAASRLLGAVFGTSNLVWASIIGLILIYLTFGYFIGGRWADRSPQPRTFYRIMLWGAFTAGIVPLISKPVLRFAADAFDMLQVPILAGSFVSVLILFFVPITLLGMISPFAIRLAITNSAEAGMISGRIYAISTLGSFIGTFLPDLLLIPLVGTTHTFLIFSAYLILVALVGLWVSEGARGALPWLWMPVVLAIIAILFASGAIKQTRGQVYETESAYNYIQVLEENGYYYLRLNEGQGIHSVYHAEQIGYGGTWMQFLAAPFFNQPPFAMDEMHSMAIVGLAAGTTARQATHVFGPIPIDGYEIDPEIIRVGQEYFGMTMPNLTAIAQDGRWGLEKSGKRYTVIGVDAYRPPYIPWHMTTVEFFEIAREHLTDDGVLVINVGRAPNDRRLIDVLTSTLQEVFPSVHVMDIPNTFNSIVYATVQPTSFENLEANYMALAQSGDTPPLLLESIQKAIVNQQPTSPQEVVFTDDRAPVEWVINNMVLNYVLNGEQEVLQ